MRIRLTDGAIKQYRLLPSSIQKKVDKQFSFLLEDIKHPSLNIKKYRGFDNLWQGRIDKGYRFYFHIVDPHYIIISIINHPK
jgi:mRNA-degrading endonuclease RelE of RelBE toxin-antitoxin system